jgi:hypothetical protein
VAARIEYGIDANQDPEGIARALIRAMAAALLEWHDSDELVRTAWEAAKWLEREADR